MHNTFFGSNKIIFYFSEIQHMSSYDDVNMTYATLTHNGDVVYLTNQHQETFLEFPLLMAE